MESVGAEKRAAGRGKGRASRPETEAETGEQGESQAELKKCAETRPNEPFVAISPSLLVVVR